MLKSSVLITVVVGLSISNQIFARPLQCNEVQSMCVSDDRKLTIGDQFGVVNEDNLLVAEGEVHAIRGDNRVLKIKNKHGKINKGNRLVLLDDSSRQDRYAVYSKYKEPERTSAGGSVGIATFGIGESFPGLEMSGFAQFRRYRDIHFVARGLLSISKGPISRLNDANEVEDGQFSMTSLGILPGAAYYFFPKSTINLRLEGGLGMAYIMSDINGKASLVVGDGYSTSIENGLKLLAAGRAGAVYRTGVWQTELAVQETILHRALSTSVSLGLIKSLE